MSETEEAQLWEKLAEILRRIAVVVNGPEPELVRWSWHDLPEKVEALTQERDALKADIATARKFRTLRDMTAWKARAEQAEARLRELEQTHK